jgi:Flp pilus assembly protein TadB
MKLLLLILGAAAVALNLFLWYSKRQAAKTKADKSSSHKDKTDGSAARSIEFSNHSEIEPLKKSAAAELGISIEQLDRLSVEEIEKIAAEKGLIKPNG